MHGTKSDRIGHFVETAFGGERVRAYVPQPLPPNPPLQLAPLMSLYDRARGALGQLDGVSTILPAAPLFLFMYIRKEALLSSQIEGTQSSLSDLLLFEADEIPHFPINDVAEVSNYVAAMEHGRTRINGGFPLSMRLLREMHQILLRSGRGASQQPGEFRTTQNWIGGTRPGNAIFVPPPPHMMSECLSDLEKYLHVEDAETPILIKAALAHVQFETIHPFLDGNGRLGRLLIALLLLNSGALHHPVLYLSLYFKTRRADYYRLLQEVRENGAWEAWIEFFLTGVAETAEQALTSARALLKLCAEDAERIRTLGRPAPTALQVHGLLQKRPATTIKSAARDLALSVPTVGKALELLQTTGIVREVTGQRRDRVFAYSAYLEQLEAGTEPLQA